MGLAPARSPAATETFKAMTPSQFFYEYRELAGFSNPARALYQTVRELVENALDATDVYGIKPVVKIFIRRVEADKYTVTVEDNGIGVAPSNVPMAFGKVLVSTKYRLKQARGRFGLGAKMAILYGQITTGQPVEIYTAPQGSKQIYYFRLKIDIQKNEPIVLAKKSWPNPSGWHGLRISVTIVGDWGRAKSKIYEYIRRTAIAAPYAEIVFVDPDGKITYYRRATDHVPPGPREVKPHPHGVDIEQLKMLISKTSANNMLDFLVESFQGVGKKTAEQFLRWAGIDPTIDPRKLSDRALEQLARKLREYPFRAPSADALSPMGEKIIETGLKTILKPEFVVAVTRRPKAYEGHPFIVEVGIAYGGEIPPSDEPILLRYANRIPLLYDERSDVAWKVVDPRNFDWRQYLVEFPAPLAVLTHICSTKVPYKGVGKESVADVPEIEKELRAALREAARKLRDYLLQKKREEEQKRRITTFIKYVPEVSKSLATILKGDGVNEEYIRTKLLEVMKKRLRLPDDKFREIVEKVNVVIEE